MRPPKNAPRNLKITPGQRLTCKATAKSGERCSRPQMGGKPFCNFHTPGLASAAGKIGGPRRKVFDPTKLLPITPPTTAQDVTKIVATLIVEVYAAKLDPKTSNAISVLAQVFLQSLEHGDMEDRVAQLEASLKAAKGQRR
jgi:hypothetical protein